MSQSVYSVKDFIPFKHLFICPLVNKDALKRKRVFITDATKQNYVYLKSECLFVEEVEGKTIKCRVIDDESKSLLDELDHFVLQEFNKNRSTFLSLSKEEHNIRNLIEFTRENGSYIKLVISDKLNIFDEKNEPITDPKLLKHRMIRSVFSPLCVDIGLENKFSVTFFGFSVAIMPNVSPPPYILQELVEENVPYVGGSLEKAPVELKTDNQIDFNKNPFL
jgi:hypothetical protein